MRDANYRFVIKSGVDEGRHSFFYCFAQSESTFLFPLHGLLVHGQLKPRVGEPATFGFPRIGRGVDMAQKLLIR
jgi:hypothetical protein